MYPEGELFNAIVYDGIVFVIQILILLFIAFKRHVGFERFFIIFYGITTFSAYNIYIEVIHDYNIPIARTFIYKLNIIGPLYFFDLFLIPMFIILLVLTLMRYIKLNAVYWKSSVGLLLIRDLFIYFIAWIAIFMYSQQNMPVDMIGQLRMARGFILGIVMLSMFMIIYNRALNTEYIMKILITILLVDFISIVGEIIATPFFGKYLWSRGNHYVTIVDQANSLLALCYLPFLFIWRKSTIYFSLFAVLIISILLYDYVKGLYFFIPIVFILYTIFKFMDGKISKFTIPILLVIIVGGVILLPSIAENKAIKGTRGIQLESYLNFINDIPSAQLIGSGVGGMYKLMRETEDGGEMKAVEREQASAYQVQFQVPVIYYYKIAGIPGILLVIVVFILLLLFAYREKKANNIVGSYFLIILAVGTLEMPSFLVSEPNTVIYYAKIMFSVLLFRLLESNKIKQNQTTRS